MSKRVLMLFGVGVLLIVGAFFLLKHEVTENNQVSEEIIEEEEEIPAQEQEQKPKGKKTKPVPSDLPTNTVLTNEPGAEATN
jgi:hypothetical protein